MGYIKKLKNNELVGGTDKHTIYPVTSTKAVFEEVTEGDKSSFKSQETINKEQQDELDDHEERIQAAEAEDIKSITINGSTKKFEVDDENNVDLTIYTVDNDPDMPDIADNVRDLRNMVGTSTPVLETSHKTRIENLETTVGTGGTIDSRIATTRAELQEQIDTKQIQLHVGSGLTLDNNGNLSATLDPAMSKVVTTWPSQSDAVKGLIYLKPTSTAGVYEQRVYNDSSYTTLDNVTLSISTDDALNTGSANPLKNSTVAAQIGYFDHTGNNDNDGSSKVKNITATGFTLPTTAGGAIKIKMKEPNTYAGTQADPVQLQFNNVTSTKKTLLYNHELVSVSNTWEKDEVISVYYDGTYYQASNAQGGGGKAEKIKYDNSASGLAAENVQGALDEVNQRTVIKENSVDFVAGTTTKYFYISSRDGEWYPYVANQYPYMCRILRVESGRQYMITAPDDAPINYALLSNDEPQVDTVATTWNNGIPKIINAGESVIVDTGNYTYLYCRFSNSAPIYKYPQSVWECDIIDDVVKELESNVANIEKTLDERGFSYVDKCPEVDYSFSASTFGSSSDYKHTAVPVTEGEEYIIEAPSSVSAFYCFATTNIATSGGAIPFAGGMTSAVSIAAGESVKVTIPEGCSYLLVYNASNTRPFLIKKELPKVETIYPLFTFDYIGGLSGDFTGNQTSFENGKNIATPRFIKTSNAFKAKANAVGSFQVYYYDSEFNFLKVIVTQYPTADVELELIPDVPHSYVKIVFQREDAFIKANISLTGIFEDNWDVFNVRPSDGYHRIGVMVDVSDAQCSDANTSTVQDEIDLRPNYGVIALPTTYSNTGKPTRLIIYCHGAGTYFNFSNATGFNTREHVDPTYWLKEGYAVMDIDGNPMWNPSTEHTSNDAHAFRPQAMEAYIAGYKWAIEHYNLYRDGALLGGRSMGGGTTMYLLRGTCPIPVVAACANLPTSVAMGTEASSKLLIANIRGFIIPDGFTFSNGPMNDADTQVFYDNWFKGIMYTPSIAICVDTPTTEEWRKNFIKNCCHVGEPYESNRIAACKDLHMIVRAPLKMFGCFEDPNNGYQATAQLYMTMLGNAGQQAEYRLYHSDKDTNYPSDDRSAHYYELADPTLRTTVTTIYGEEVTNVPMVYVEMLQFWRRYEQNM